MIRPSFQKTHKISLTIQKPRFLYTVRATEWGSPPGAQEVYIISNIPCKVRVADEPLERTYKILGKFKVREEPSILIFCISRIHSHGECEWDVHFRRNEWMSEWTELVYHRGESISWISHYCSRLLLHFATSFAYQFFNLFQVFSI